MRRQNDTYVFAAILDEKDEGNYYKEASRLRHAYQFGHIDGKLFPFK